MTDVADSDSDTVTDLAEVHGQRLADAIDRRYERLLDRAIQRWDAQVRSEGISPPEIARVREQLVEYSWTSFSSTQIAWDKPSSHWLKLPGKSSYFFDLLVHNLDFVLGDAIRPITMALHDGDLCAEGVPEPEAAHGWQSVVLPIGFFKVGRYMGFRNGSRLVQMSRTGQEETAFNAVMLTAPGRAEDAPVKQALPTVRAKLRRWLETTARDARSDGWSKIDFLAAAKLEIGIEVTDNLFSEVWRMADIPAKFKKQGRRRK